MRKPHFKPILWKAHVHYCAVDAPVAVRTHYLHAESSAAAYLKVKTFYRQQGLQAQIATEKASTLYLPEAIAFARESNAIQEHRHLSDYARWERRYSTHDSLNSKADMGDSFARAFSQALASAQA